MKFRLFNLISGLVILAISFGLPNYSLAQTGVVNSNATQAQNQNNKAGDNNIMLGQALIGIGSAMPFCTGCYLIYMGVTAIKQGQTQKDRAQQSARTAYDSSYAATQFSSYINKDAANALADAEKYLAGQGYKFDPKSMSVTNPDGKKFNLKDLSRDAGAMALQTGLPQEDIEKALKAMDGKAKEISKDVKVAKVEMSKSSGSSVTGGDSGSAGAGISGFNFGMGRRKPTNTEVSGLKKYLGSDQVGVAGDDIFLMVQRRYQEKNRAEYFSK